MKNRKLFRTHGFTLIELLVSMVVLSLLIAMVVQLTNGATAASGNSLKHLDADGQARLVFDRMAIDLQKMFQRKDADVYFNKQAGNDNFFFYSEVPGYATSATNQSSVSLVGYRINTANTYHAGVPVLERLGKSLTWDGGTPTATTPGSPIFLSYPGTAASAAPTTATPDPNSTISGNWSAVVPTGTDIDYQIVSEQVFRLEFAFSLTDGTVSASPVLSVTPATWANPTAPFYTSSKNDPLTSAAGTATAAPYVAGSRWLNTSNQQGYICTGAANTGATNWALTWNRIGLQDVSALIVTMGVLDPASRQIVTKYDSLLSALADPTTSDLSSAPPKLMATTWTNAVNAATFAQTAGIPPSAAAQVRIYQRTFYLNQ